MKPMIPGKTFRLLVSLAWLLSSLSLPLHEALHAPEGPACLRCLSAQPEGLDGASVHDDDCSNPGHHRHPARKHDACSICVSASQAAMAVSSSILERRSALEQAPASQPSTPEIQDSFGIPPSRAPPSIS